jgi:membrane protease subunit (stomatin/prohibitin family)
MTRRKDRKDGSDLSSTAARAWEDMRAAKEREWENLGVVDEIYHKVKHVPCGTVVQISAGRVRMCPKCQPEEWEKEHCNK